MEIPARGSVVRVEWMDICFDPEFEIDSEGLGQFEPVLCVTYGEIVSQQEGFVVIASTVMNYSSPVDVRIRDYVAFPLGVITSVTELVELVPEAL